MKNLLVALMLALLTTTAFAEIDTSGLDAAQQAAIEVQAATLRKANAEKRSKEDVAPAAPIVPAVPVAKKVDEWVDVGIKVGQAMGGAAREMSLAVNDFARTPVGMVTMAIIVFKMMGTWVLSMLYHMIGALCVAAFGAGFMLYMNRNTRMCKITYDTAGNVDIFGRSVIKSKEYSSMDDGTQACMYMVALVTIIASLITGFSGAW